MDKVCTLLLTDIVDSTALNSRLGDAAMAALWEQHDGGSRELARRFDGTEVDRSDGFLMLFDDAEAALGFVIAYHRFLAALPVPLRARAGLHRGPLTLHHRTPGDIHWGGKPLEVVGIAKAMTARFMALAGAGQTLASAAVVAALEGRDVRWQSHGHWRFKGIDDPVEVFEVGDEQAPFMPPPDAEKAQRVIAHRGQWIGAADVPRRLPAERDSFRGRGNELRRIAALFDRGDRLVVVQGPGGVGKTRLALRHAWGWLGRYPGGAYFCDAASATSAEGVLNAVGRALQAPLGKDPVAQLAAAIHGHGPCLMVLDNVEQVLEDTNLLLARWLDAAPQARWLVTSRDGLGLVGEQRVAVEPLDTAAAIALFHDRASAIEARYDAVAVDIQVMQALVTRLDCLPLALELAAARAPVLAPAELLQRLEDRFQLLASRSGRPERHLTLRAAIAWSWEALGADEAAALGQLSAFEDGFTLAAAESVVKVDSSAAVVDLLQALVDKSLVRKTRASRFELLTSIREYGAAELATDAARAAWQRHATFFAGLNESQATADRCADVSNLVLACRRGIGLVEPIVLASLLRNAWGALRLTGPLGAAADLAAAIEPAVSADAEAAAAVAAVAGGAFFAMGAFEPARTHAQRGLALLTEQAGDELKARLYCLAGELAAMAGEGDAADGWLQGGLELARRSGDLSLQCQLLNALGAAASDQGHAEAARRHYEEALHIAEAAGLAAWRGGLLGNLGWVHHAAGRLEPARHAFSQALQWALASGDRRWEGNARSNLGLIAHEQGDAETAQREFEQALVLARRIGHGALECTVTCNLGLVREALGDLEGACRQHAAAVAAAGALGDAPLQAQMLAYEASALARSGHMADALARVQRGWALAGVASEPLRAVLLCAQAEVAGAAGSIGECRQLLAQARRLDMVRVAGPASELGLWLARIEALSRD
jgi:predicted ATPase/class 3 adenylate cyclase